MKADIWSIQLPAETVECGRWCKVGIGVGGWAAGTRQGWAFQQMNENIVNKSRLLWAT